MLRSLLRVGLVAVLGAALITLGPTPTAQATSVAAPAEETLAAATVAVQRAASTVVLAVRVVRGDTSWGLAARYCGAGAAHETGVSVRSPQGSVRAPATIWPGDWATVSCARTTTTTQTRAPSAGAWVAPVPGTLRCTSRWGDPRDGGSRRHKGVDIPRAYGTPIRAVAVGTVRMVRYSVNSSGIGAGWYVMVDHGGGTQTVSMHQRGRPPVSVGQRVARGQTIGYVGSSGAHSAHLHFEVHRGPWTAFWTQVNPGPVMRAHGLATVSCG